MKQLACFLLLSSSAFAQSITIPAQTINVPITVNGAALSISVTIPAQTVALPSQAGLPAGMSYSNTTGLAVQGGITATQLSLTGGSSLPSCASALYLWQLANGSLSPVCYTAPVIPMVSVTQPGRNVFTVLP